MNVTTTGFTRADPIASLVVEEAIELYRKDGKPLPLPTSGRDFANKMQRSMKRKAATSLRLCSIW